MTTTTNQAERSIFVTVGTTLFDALIRQVSSISFLDTLLLHDYTSLVIQYGNGDRPVIPSLDDDEEGTCVYTDDKHGNRSLLVQTYRFKPNLSMDMRRASIILSHAGAGSIMEGLELSANNKTTKLVVVINTKLMHNHQYELANALERRGYLLVISNPADVPNILTRVDTFTPRVFEGGDGCEMFGRLVDRHMGFHSP